MNRLHSTTIGHTPTIIGLSFNLNEFWSSSKLDFVQTFWTQCVQESSGSRSTNNQVTSVSEIISAEHIVNSFMAETASVVGYPRLLSPLFTFMGEFRTSNALIIARIFAKICCVISSSVSTLLPIKVWMYPNKMCIIHFYERIWELFYAITSSFN